MENPKFKLVVGIDDDDYIANPEGFFSTDSCPRIMEEFFKRLGYRYERSFVSISVRPFASVQGKFVTADLYGHPFVLKDEVIRKVQIVAVGDFLNIMDEAIADILRGGDIESHRNKVILLEEKSDDKKCEVIWKAHNAKKTGYAEVRLYGSLSRDDCEDPDSGLNSAGLQAASDGGEDFEIDL
jgi:hypothetical protein